MPVPRGLKGNYAHMIKNRKEHKMAVTKTVSVVSKFFRSSPRYTWRSQFLVVIIMIICTALRSHSARKPILNYRCSIILSFGIWAIFNWAKHQFYERTFRQRLREILFISNDSYAYLFYFIYFYFYFISTAWSQQTSSNKSRCKPLKRSTEQLRDNPSTNHT